MRRIRQARSSRSPAENDRSAHIGIVLALTSALIWGSGDFAGGLATRRGGQFEVLALAALSGIAILVGCLWLTGEALPSLTDMAWAASAGLTGAVGLASLYRGLATGSAATVAPAAAVVTAALPAVFSSLTSGLPKPLQLAGFVIAFVGIWLVARSASSERAPVSGLRFAFVAGIGFGSFLILIAQVPATLVFGPLAVARVVMFLTAISILVARGSRLPSLTSNPVALLAGVLDAGGNVFYMLARQHTRLDIAAVLSSLYPVATVVLARVISGDSVSRSQWVGAAVCLLAVVLITL